MDSLEMAKKIANIVDDMKAQNIKILKVDEVSSLADYFVLITGNSSTQVQAFSDKIELTLKQEGTMPYGVEGHRASGWILIDYGSVIVHVFTTESRSFYDLDRLWQDADVISLS